MYRVIIPLFVLLPVAAAAGVTTTCYTCTTAKNNSKCGMDFDVNSIGTEECALPVCLKNIQGGVITRGCGYKLKDEGCFDEGSGTLCVCRQDLCNDAMLPLISTATMTLTPLVSLAFLVI